MSFWGFRDYVSVAERRKQAAGEVEKLKRKGHVVAPVVISGRKIAQSVWGKAWCDNLERYSDFETRLPRGRTYVRNGSVIDLKIDRGRVLAMVSGSEVYQVKVDIVVAAPDRWRAICRDCAGSVGSLVELLQGRLSTSVMERVCRVGDGLFPAPTEIKMSCSCPDWADMCKHVAAVLYGIGARLDAAPELLFTLRGVDHADFVTNAGAGLSLTGGVSERILTTDDVAALFGLDLEMPGIAERSADPPAVDGRTRRPRKMRSHEAGSTAPQLADTMPVEAARQTVKQRSGTHAATKPGASTKQAAATAAIEADALGKPAPKRFAKNAHVNVAVLPRDRKRQAGFTGPAKRTTGSPTNYPAESPSASRAAATAKHQPASKTKAEATFTKREKSNAKVKVTSNGEPDAGRTRAARWIGAKARKARG
jgi:uncharacterized Zn finger protein